MSDNLSTPLDLHRRLAEIAQKAVTQVRNNPVGNDQILPADTPPPSRPDPRYS